MAGRQDLHALDRIHIDATNFAQAQSNVLTGYDPTSTLLGVGAIPGTTVLGTSFGYQDRILSTPINLSQTAGNASSSWCNPYYPHGLDFYKASHSIPPHYWPSSSHSEGFGSFGLSNNATAISYMPYLPILSAGATAATAADMSSLFPPTITPHMPQTPTANVQPIYHRIYDLGQKDTKCMNDSFLISSAIPAQQTVYPQQQQQQTLVATGPIITTTTPVLPAKSIATPQRPLEPKPIRPNSSTSSNKANTDGKMEQVAAKNSAISNNSSVAKSPNSKSPGNTSNESRRVEIKCKTGSNFKSNKSAADTTTKTVNSTSPESCRDKTKNDEREIKNPSHTSHTVSNILKLKTPESKTGKHVAVETSTSSAAAVTVSSSLVGKYSKNDGTRKVERNVVDSTMNDDTNVKVDDNQELDVVTSSDDTRIPADDRLKTRDAADDERMVLTRNVGDKTERKTSTSSVPNDHRRNNYAGKCDIENSWSGVEKYRDSFIIDSVAAKRAVQSFTFHDDDEIRLKPGHLDDGLNQSICDNTVSCIKPDTCSSSSSYRSGGSGSIVTSDITDRNKITSPTSTTPRKTPPISTGNTEPVANSDVKTDGLTSKSPDRGSAYACPVSSPGSNTSSSSSSNGEFVPALSPAHHLPYYQSLYSIAKTKTTAKDRRKVHAMTFTPEIGTMPGVNPAPANAATSSKCPTITKKEATREVGKRTSGRNSHSRSTKNNSGQKTKKCNDNKRVNASDVTAGWKQTPAAVSNERKRKNDCSKTKKNDTEKLTEESVTGDRVNEINITAPASVHCFANSNDADTCSGVGGSQRSPVSTGSVVDSSVLLPSYADIIHHPGPINLHTGSLKSHAAKTHPNPSGTVAISSPVHGRSNSSSSSSTSAAVYSWNRSLTTCPSRSTVLRGDLGKSVDYATPKRCVNRNAKEADTIRESAIGSKKSGSNKSGHQRRQVLSVDEKKRKTAENIPIASVQATSLSNDHQELENNSTNDSGASTVTSSANAIPVGIAVARKRENQSKQQQKSGVGSTTTQIGATQNSRKDREEFLRQQKELLSPQNKPTQCHRPELTSNLIVTGGNNNSTTTSAASILGWHETDTRSHHLAPPHPPWPIQAGSAMAPTFWLGQGPYSLPSALPVDPISMATSNGWKLAQDPLTGQLYIIPATNLDMLDPTRMWSGYASGSTTASIQPLLTGHSSAQLQQNHDQNRLSASHSNIQKQNDDGSSLVKVSSFSSAQMAPISLPITTSASSLCCETKDSVVPATNPFLPRGLTMGTGQTYPYTYPSTPMPLVYDPNYMPPVAPLTPAISEPMMQSRGTSPMVFMSNMSDASIDSASEDNGPSFSAISTAGVLQSTTSVQTSDLESMKDSSSQSSGDNLIVDVDDDSQTEEEERRVDEEPSEELEVAAVVDSTEPMISSTTSDKCGDINVDVVDDDVDCDRVDSSTKCDPDSDGDLKIDCDKCKDDDEEGVDLRTMESLKTDSECIPSVESESIPSACDTIRKDESAAKFDESDDAVNVVSNESESKENMCEETCKLNAERPQRSLSGLDALVQVISNDLESEEFCSSRSVQQPDDDRLIDNSFKNLGSNLASVFKYPDNVFSLTSDDLKSSSAKMNLLPVCNEYSTTNSGLDLLSALAEQRRDELISPQSRKSESSLSSLCSPDINRNYEGSLDKWDMSSLSSPGSSSGARTRRESGPNSPFSLYNEMDMTELEMRMKLAEIQRRYKEKQKELAKLQPRKDRDHDSKRGPGRPKKRKLSKQSSKSSDCKEMLSDGDCKSPKILEPPPPKKKKTSSNKPETESKEVKLKVSSKSVKKKDLTISQVSPPVTICKSDSQTPKPVVAVATIQSAPVQKHKSETEDIRIATKPAEKAGSCEILKPLKQSEKKDAESVMKKKQKFENEPLKPSEKSASKQTATTIKVESHAQQKQPFIVKKEPMSDSDSDSEDSWMTLQELAGKVKRESQMQIDSIKQQSVTGIDTSGLGLLAKYASASTVIDAKTKLSEKKSNKDITNAPVKKRKRQKDGEATSESPMSKKRKPGRPKKLSPEKPSETETIVAKKPKNIGLQLQLDLERKKEQQQNTGDSKKDQIKMKPEKKDDTNISLKMKENKAAEVNKKDGGREIDRKKPSVKQETEKVTSNLKEMKTVGSKQGNVLVETTKDQERNVKKQKSETQMDKKETHKNKKEVEEPNVKKEKLEVDTENKKEEQMPITKNMDNKEKDKNKTALVKKETTMTKNNESKKERNEMDKQNKECEASNKEISEMRVSSSTNNDIRNAELTKPLKIETDSQKWSHEWSIRRSERIFLSDSSPQQSPNMGPIYRSPPQQHQQPQSSSPPTHNKSSSVSPPSDKKSPLLSQMQTLTQKVKKKYSKAAMNKGKKKYKLPEKFKYSEIYTDSEPDSDEIDEEDEDSDNKPLTAFIEKSRKAELQSCVLDKDELKDGLRILLFMEDLFYEGEVKAIQPPDIYGVLVYGERGNRPHILPQEELLREAVLDLKPKSPDDLPEGRRICAYWSQQFSCLYPGTVAKSSPNPDANKNLINVEFDDGDSGKIPMDHIRMLPQHFPQCCTSESTFLLDPASKRKKRTSSEDLMCLENKERKPSLGNTLPGFNLDKIRKKCSTLKYNKVEKKVRHPQSSDSDGSSFEMSNLCEQLDNIVSKERKKKKYKRIKDMTEKNLSGNKNRSSAVLKKSLSHQKPILSKSHFKNGADFGLKMKKSTLKIGPGNNRRNANNSSRPSLNWASSDDERCSAATSSEEESSDDEQNNSPNKQQRRKSPATKTRKSPTKKESKSSSKTDVLIPLCDIWSWHGKSTQRPGLKGKAKKIYFKAIQRGDEIIKVGDSAVFISTGRPHLPYVGRIENLWEAWGGNMVVRVKWFYHPEETKGCGNKLTDPDDALFESPHGDDNDVQTISHRCEVLSYKEYRKRAVSDADMTDVYYLAGYYDPVLSYATFRSHVSRM